MQKLEELIKLHFGVNTHVPQYINNQKDFNNWFIVNYKKHLIADTTPTIQTDLFGKLTEEDIQQKKKFFENVRKFLENIRKFAKEVDTYFNPVDRFKNPLFFFLDSNILKEINKDHYIGEYEGMVDNFSVYNTLIRENVRKTELYDINSAVFANNTLFYFETVELFSELQEKYKQLQTSRKNFIIELQKQK